MLISYTFPTVFAKKIARKVGLYTEKSNLNNRMTMGSYEDDEKDLHICLAEFQQMAIAGIKIDECKLAYHDIQLTAKQEEALDLIYKSTKPWLMGHVIGQLSEKLMNSNDRDFVEACELLIDTLNCEKNKNYENNKKLIVKFSE